MPSELHDTLVQLFRDQPVFIKQVINNDTRIAHEPFTHARLVSENATVLKSTERRTDATIELFNEETVARLIVVLEVQLRIDKDKLRTWPTYVCRMHEDMDCPIVLVVICTDEKTAQWASRPIEIGPVNSQITPVALGPASVPQIVDPDSAEATPEMTVLSVIMHSHTKLGTRIIDAMDMVLATIDTTRAADYTDYAMGLLRGKPRAYLEALMSTATAPYHSEFAGRFYKKGKAEGQAQGRAEGQARGRSEGRAEGQAKMLLILLDHRGIALSKTDRHKIQTCTDTDLLQTWAVRATSAETVADIFD